MTGLSKEILENRQVRKTRAQKSEFIEFIQSHIPEARVEQKGISRNIVIGDPDSAKAVLGAHYDTCAIMPVPNFLTPKNVAIYIVYQLVVVAVLLAAAYGLSALVEHFTHSFEIAYIVGLLFYFLVLGLMMAGPANRHTANDNTSGVITVLECYAAMSPEQREKLCFVLFDNEEVGLLGSAAFNKMHRESMKDKPLINFDCVSDGDHMMLVIKKKAEAACGDLLRSSFRPEGEKKMLFEKSSNTIYPSDQANFPLGVAVSCFNKAPVIGYYMDKIHTPRDRVFDLENIEMLKNSVLRFADGI